jgi:hypothetical protein
MPKYKNDLDLDGNKIINVIDPVDDQDVASKKYVDDNAGGGSSPSEMNGIRLRSDASQGMDALTDVVVQWDVQDFMDSAFSHSIAVDNSRIQVLNTGKYLLIGIVNYYGTTGNYRFTSRLSIRINGSTILPHYFDGTYIRATSGANEIGNGFSIILDLVAGDYIEILSKRMSTVAGNAVTTSGTGLNMVELIGPAGADGTGGLSAYEVWKNTSPQTGSETVNDFLTYLGAVPGADGEQGIQGDKGDTGNTGNDGADSTVQGPAGNDGLDGLTYVATQSVFGGIKIRIDGTTLYISTTGSDA